jgi:hypothetical protein
MEKNRVKAGARVRRLSDNHLDVKAGDIRKVLSVKTDGKKQWLALEGANNDCAMDGHPFDAACFELVTSDARAIEAKSVPPRFLVISGEHLIEACATNAQVRAAIVKEAETFEVGDAEIFVHEIKSTHRVELGVKVTLKKL